MRSAAALLDLVDGVMPRARQPVELIETVTRVARLQAIKCVPRTATSEPCSPMWRHCPRFLLEDELEILRPRILLVLGANPLWVVRQLDGYKSGRSSPHVTRGRLIHPDWGTDIYAIHHPAHGGEAAERALLRSLQATARHRRRTGAA